MKKSIILFSTLFAIMMSFTGCHKDENKEYDITYIATILREASYSPIVEIELTGGDTYNAGIWFTKDKVYQEGVEASIDLEITYSPGGGGKPEVKLMIYENDKLVESVTDHTYSLSASHTVGQ